jgi:Spy/CpxP family protein refolding chaperone
LATLPPMNINRYTSMGLGTVIVAALAIGACNDDSKNNTQAPAGSASTTASAPSASASAAGSAAPSASAAASATPPADSEDDKLATEELIEHHRFHHGGITSFISMSLDTLGVAAERKAAVEKIQHDLDTRALPLHEAQRALLSKLADGVAAGAVDAAKANADLAAVAKASGTVRTASAELIAELHKTLIPAERTALVDKVQAHWEVWRQANESAKSDSGTHEAGRLDRLTKQLDLKPDQVAKIEAAIKPGETPIEPKMKTDIDARLTAFSASFASEKFDPKTLAAWEPDDPHLASAGATRMVKLCEAIAPVLTPEQRTKFAEHIREHRLEMPTAPAAEKKKEAP